MEIWKRLDRKYNDKSKMVDSIMKLSNNTDNPSEILHGIKVIQRAQ